MYRIYLGGVQTNNEIGNLSGLVHNEVVIHKDSYESTNVFTEDYFNNMIVGEWVKLRTFGSNFSPRTGHECIFYKKKIYLFGGTDQDDRKNDLYSFDIY